MPKHIDHLPPLLDRPFSDRSNSPSNSASIREGDKIASRQLANGGASKSQSRSTLKH